MSLARWIRPACAKRFISQQAYRSFATALPKCIAPCQRIAPFYQLTTPRALATRRTYTTEPTYTATTLTIDQYHDVSDEMLDHIDETLEAIGEEVDLPGFDIEYSQGVMTIRLGDHGTYVLNKQPPNQQIWLSSPKSGPKRFDYDAEHKKWFYLRDNHTLDGLLNEELSDVFGKQVDVLEGFAPQ